MVRLLRLVGRAWAYARTRFWSSHARSPAPRTLVIRWKADVPAPHELSFGKAIVVGPREAPKWLTFRCPCGCDVPLLLSLSRTRRPRWSVEADRRGRPTVTPSIRRLDGCRSHFWVRNGRIDWCADTGLVPEVREFSH